MYSYVAAVWLGKFRSEADLSAYMDRDEGLPFPEPSLFAHDTGLPSLVDDLVEFIFHPDLAIEEMLNHFSYSGFFREELMAEVQKISSENPGSNALIIVFGQKHRERIENEFIFDYQMTELPASPLIPVGKFKFYP